MTFPFYTAKGPQAQNPNFSVTLRRVFINEAPPLYRTFFVIRHGESKWNEAQEKIHIAGMLNKDHPLTEDGINQALTLNARWKLATGSHGGLSKGIGSDSQIIDCGRLNEEDLRPVEAGEDDGDSDGEGGGPSSSGASSGRGKGLTKLYDSIFQKHSSVTAAGKARDTKPAEPVTPKGGSAHTKPVERASLVPSFLDSDILDFSSDADPSAPKSTMPPQPPPPPSDSVDLLDGFYDMSVSAPTSTAVTTPIAAPAPTSRAVTVAAGASAAGTDDDGEVSDHEDPQIEGDDLPQRREEYIKLFMRADIVYASPLTRALQTALASMCGHPALTKHKLTLYSIIREIKRIGGLDTVGIEFGPGIMRRVKTELQLTMGVARAHEVFDNVKVDVNDADQPWWTAISSFENEKDQLERVREFVTFSRYCGHGLPVFVGHSLFFKAFYSKRVSAVLARKRPHLSANLKRYRLSNATLLAVTVRYRDLENGSSEAVILDADLPFGGGFHGFKHAHGEGETSEAPASKHAGVRMAPAASDIDGAHASRRSSAGTSGSTSGTNRNSTKAAITKRMSMFSSAVSDFFEK
eukprot:CAMPEP_0184980830 /NCGR_PEP_ID=MMETSP1098-20130426/10714_1 /TAXON_ID=89044 /ORGANISM="Spumella elongata, Strain CCAP 955/1" /LENGTH=577 /DNA_ID=CAMNT_0027504313 /DNA_START=415 /DNA_END=2148 /DNA_ORIENTATION=-